VVVLVVQHNRLEQEPRVMILCFLPLLLLVGPEVKKLAQQTMAMMVDREVVEEFQGQVDWETHQLLRHPKEITVEMVLELMVPQVEVVLVALVHRHLLLLVAPVATA
jgi:hypothetical protein